ncbi:MAG TPA: hypothetical protein VE995_09280 [Gaiellaceae bacterium]|nr:hypothetical protein [Gaiellaceae bacterium]
MAKKNARGEIRLLPARRVPLPAAQYEEAVSLLAELLLDAAEAKRREGRSVGVIGSASGSVMGSVVPFPRRGRKGREAAWSGATRNSDKEGQTSNPDQMLRCRAFGASAPTASSSWRGI